ncbi:MAG: hypothetical protein JNL11_20110 [Bdellovibrionaceae bacterium]|nr:hypothetical protein [Pseudobdellovibrionaceae bacterium]
MVNQFETHKENEIETSPSKEKRDQKTSNTNQKQDHEKKQPFSPTFPIPNGPEIVDLQAHQDQRDTPPTQRNQF